MSCKQNTQARRPFARPLSFPVRLSTKRFDLIVSLFGSPSYIYPAALDCVHDLLRPKGKLVMMFIAPDYSPITHEYIEEPPQLFAHNFSRYGTVDHFGNYVLTVQMKYYQDKTVYEAALERIRFLYQEFEDVIVSFSGGKDSTVTLHMTLRVARELNRLPVKVVFLDQEAEWQTVIDYIKTVSQMPGVEMWWFQMPLKLFNSASSDTDWLHCWEEGKQWMRPRRANSIQVNRYNCDRFKELFKKISVIEWGEKRIAWVAGVKEQRNHRLA